MQAFNKRPRVDQVGRAEAFHELIINGLQQYQGLIAATLALPEGSRDRTPCVAARKGPAGAVQFPGF